MWKEVAVAYLKILSRYSLGGYKENIGRSPTALPNKFRSFIA
jgi:hypothetical protein